MVKGRKFIYFCQILSYGLFPSGIIIYFLNVTWVNNFNLDANDKVMCIAISRNALRMQHQAIYPQGAPLFFLKKKSAI